MSTPLAPSYLFDPVQVPSPGFVNEVNNCKLEEDDTIRLKGAQKSEVEVPRNALHGGSLSKSESRGSTTGLPRQGSLPQEDSEERPCVEKHGIVNGISPTATLQSVRSPRPHQVDNGSWASSPWVATIDSAHPAQPFLEDDYRRESCVLPTLEGSQMVGHEDCRAPAEALAVADHIPYIPAPDYPQLWSPAVDNADPEEKDCLFENHSEVEPLPGVHPRVSQQQGLNMPFSLKRSWDSLNEAGTTEVLSVYFKEEDPTHPTPAADSGDGREDPRTYTGDREGVVEDEDAEVAEALAALEAATAGEDADDAD